MVTLAVGTSRSNEAGESKSWQKHYSPGKCVMRGKKVLEFMNVADVRDNGKCARVKKWRFMHNLFG